MKFLLDENVHQGFCSFLRGLGHEVILSPKGVKNGEVFKLAQQQECILLTRDADFTAEHYKNKLHLGIILLRVPAGDLEAQQKGMLALFQRYNSLLEWQGKIIVLTSETGYAVL